MSSRRKGQSFTTACTMSSTTGRCPAVGGSYHQTNIRAILIIASESAALSCHFQASGSEPSEEQGREGSPGVQTGRYGALHMDLSCGSTSSKASQRNPTASCLELPQGPGHSLQEAVPARSGQTQLLGMSGVNQHHAHVIFNPDAKRKVKKDRQFPLPSVGICSQ